MSDPAIADFCSRHRLPASAVDEFLELMRRSTSGSENAQQTWSELGGGSDHEPATGARYTVLGTLGTGAMGRVEQVRDTRLRRTVARKTLHRRLQAAGVDRFVAEAQATAQLQHPNILPVYDAGVEADGQAWFTMKEVDGQTLSAAIAKLHAGQEPQWSFRRLVAAVMQCCNAVAYAHERGVVHRDLKPANIVLGHHGEVYVLDWGLAKVRGSTHDQAVHTDLSASGSQHTRVGAVAGTPQYMSPEQALGASDRADARSDVFGLGAVLFELLAGRAPFSGQDSAEVIAAVASGRRDPLSGVLPIPEELASACDRAMAHDPADRFPSASALAEAIEQWLDGARRRDHARTLALSALDGDRQAAALRAQAAQKRTMGGALLRSVDAWRPEEDKAPGWALQDDAEALEHQAELAELEVEQGLQAALRIAPDLVEAHRALAERYREEHQLAEAARDRSATARAEALTRLHASSLPSDHPERERCLTWLRGDGALTLVTDPPGAEVLLHRYELRNRRLVEVPAGTLGQTPLVDHSLPRGSYVCHLVHPDRPPVRYPVEIERLGHWDGVAPGETEPTPIWLPEAGALDQDEVYVPAGWFRLGGDPRASRTYPAQRAWCDARVFQRFPVTNARFLDFLNDLISQGRQPEALAHVPRARSDTADEQGPMVYGFDGERFHLRVDDDGVEWMPQWPVLLVTWTAAKAWLEWRAGCTGRPWRLPTEVEWEKAARGVDGRWFPWGDHLDPSWCLFTHSHHGRRLPANVQDFPVDRSPYGLRGAGGNALDWCLDTALAPPALEDGRATVPADSAEPEFGAVRGGSWINSDLFVRCANRSRNQPNKGAEMLSFRGVFDVEAWRSDAS